MWILALIGKMCSVIFFFGAWWFYIPPKIIDENDKNLENKILKDNDQQVMIDEIQQVSEIKGNNIGNGHAQNFNINGRY